MPPPRLARQNVVVPIDPLLIDFNALDNNIKNNIIAYYNDADSKDIFLNGLDPTQHRFVDLFFDKDNGNKKNANNIPLVGGRKSRSKSNKKSKSKRKSKKRKSKRKSHKRR